LPLRQESVKRWSGIGGKEAEQFSCRKSNSGHANHCQPVYRLKYLNVLKEAVEVYLNADDGDDKTYMSS
jgi:hypothetical protein